MRSARLPSASFVFALLTSTIACAPTAPDNGPGTGGAVGVGSTGGSTSTGGASSSSGGATSSTGGSASGGTVGSSGGATAATGGAPASTGGTGSGSGGRVGTGGGSSSSGGAGGNGTGGGSASGGAGGGGARTVKPSAGCSRGSTQVTIANSLVGLPTGYNGKDPVPAVIAFHAAGNDNTSMERTFKTSDLGKKYLMVYPNSSTPTNGWNYSADKGRYLDAHAALLSQACVDENRVYATGHSSGAQMIAQLLCKGDGDFDAVAPVASSVYCSKWAKGPVPALVIHGVKDTERAAYGLNDGNGAKDIVPYLTSNMCQMTSTPFDPVLTGCTNVKTGIDSKPFDDGCVEFSGCSVKTRWCNHNDPQYGTSNHGIPCFGVRAIYDFFESFGP
jgi:polyhydroxybutyrate depolymerase